MLFNFTPPRRFKLFNFTIPPMIWFQWGNITHLFITIAPEKCRSKYLNIAPNCAQRGKCLYMLKCFLPCERIVLRWKWTFFLTSPPSARRAEMFWNAVEKSFILRLHDDFHQPRPQYALRTIDHTTLSVGHYPLVVLNKFWRTSARSAEVVLTIALILFTKFLLNQSEKNDGDKNRTPAARNSLRR